MSELRARIIGAAESPYLRHPPADCTTETLIADAFLRVLSSAQIQPVQVDGLGIASFTLNPDHAIDIAWKLGVRPKWLMDDYNGGASGIQLLQHAIRAIEAGDASTIVLIASDRLDRDDFKNLVDSYNRATQNFLTPLAFGGPNALFSIVTRAQMDRFGLERDDYGHLVIGQRRWASLNPGAVYRSPLSLDDYREAPMVSPPLGRYDCVPVVSGADALVVASATSGVAVRAIQALHNHDGQTGDGLQTGLAGIAADLCGDASVGPADVDVISIYDDYPAMVYAQLADLGFVSQGDIRRFVREHLIGREYPLNTSGGQLSAGQAGAAGGMHGLVEATLQLLGRAGRRQVRDAEVALVTGYGMVLYRYGACANAAVLSRS